MKKVIKKKKVFVSGCFDLLHSCHIKFFQKAARLGDLYVSIGSDKTYRDYKHKDPVYNEKERKFMIENLKCVKEAFISRPKKILPGVIDFDQDLRRIKPDYFYVNADGVNPEKRKLMKELGIKLIVGQRNKFGSTERATSDLRKNLGK